MNNYSTRQALRSYQPLHLTSLISGNVKCLLSPSKGILGRLRLYSVVVFMWVSQVSGIPPPQVMLHTQILVASNTQHLRVFACSFFPFILSFMMDHGSTLSR